MKFKAKCKVKSHNGFHCMMPGHCYRTVQSVVVLKPPYLPVVIYDCILGPGIKYSNFAEGSDLVSND